MREGIGLFRGKRIDNGEWAIGNLWICGDDAMICIYDRNRGFPCWLAVDPNTIGEYTGLQDKNGKLIFEGDIVKNRHNKGVIIYGKWNCGCCYDVYGWTIDILDDMHYIEVVGNIHDNPELLKGGEN